MARPSKLSERQKAEIGRRLAKGESQHALAKAFHVAQSTIRANVSVHPAEIQDIASRLAGAERDLDALPVSVQISVRSLADELKQTSIHLGKAAERGAYAASRWATHSARIADELSPEAGREETMDAARASGIVAAAGNQNASVALGLLQANKASAPDDKRPIEPELTDEELEKEIKRMLKARR